VGRSTAPVALAKRLAEKGRRVLVVDLDMESPGPTSSCAAWSTRAG
jgi:Mrp family chromosome partitioning ATPase